MNVVNASRTNVAYCGPMQHKQTFVHISMYMYVCTYRKSAVLYSHGTERIKTIFITVPKVTVFASPCTASSSDTKSGPLANF